MRRLILLLTMLTAALPAGAGTRVPHGEGEITLSFAPVARAAMPAVVNIYARRVVEAHVSPFAGDPFFSQFFGNGPTRPQVQNSLGSGVIVGADGWIVTNFHVVGGADDIRIVTSDRREYGAKVVLGDAATDVAVLRIDGVAGLPVLPFRPTDEVEVGELVLAIGNPFGVGQTVSSGLVSAVARTGFGTGNVRGYYVQTDAAINPGNSGGALVDAKGRLVGINTSILTRSGGSNGIGFAIPADLVAVIVGQARAGNARFDVPWAGMSGQAVDFALAETLGLARVAGMIVTGLHDQSPFAVAGLMQGDVILEIDGHEVLGPAETLYRLMLAGPASVVSLRSMRGGAETTADVTLISPSEDPPRAALTIATGAFAGLGVATINPAVMAELGLPIEAAGVVVTASTGTAAQLGFQRGDILTTINGAPISTTAQLEAAVAENTRRWEVEMLRGGQRLHFRFRI